MANKTNLGRVVGYSSFEEWEKRNPGKTWDDFMKAIQGPGILGFRYKETTETGSLIYDVILDGDIVSGTIEIPPGATGADFLTLEFVRFDDEGNTIVKSKNSKGELGNEILIKRGPRGYTGGTVGGEEPSPPIGANYGDKKEWAGSYVPDGWALCNGGTLSGKKYPHLIGLLDYVSEPTEVKYKFVDSGTVSSNSAGGSGSYWNRKIVCGGKTFQSSYHYRNASYGLNNGLFYSTTTSRYKSNGIYNYVTIPDSSTKHCIGFIGELSLGDSFFYPKAIAIDGLNHEFGGMLPDDNGSTGGYNIVLHPDIYFNIEYVDENGDWRLGVQLHNKTDFVKSTTLDNMYIASLKTTFKTNKIRLSIDPKSTPHYPSSNYYYIGKFHTYLDDISNRDMTVIKLPDEKDSSGKYKLVYIGQPLEVQEPGMYSYSRDNTLNGEVPFSLAVENKLPNYSEGITMAEPKETKMGYINKYNNELDTWELIRTHKNKEGYYYDDLGDLKYTPKPNNYSVWDIVNYIWNENQELKEQEKQRLTDELIALEIKKDKMVDLNLETNQIMEKIKLINKEIENINR
ncbi:MAG: phage tail protein [Filifactoraceae bacterium]